MLRLIAILLILYAPSFALAVEYDCKVEKKFNRKTAYTAKQLEKWQFSVKIEEIAQSAFLSRCSLSPSAGKVTCDRYEADKVEFDKNVKIKKYYVLRSHFDVQLFSDLYFIENNGRGDIAFGQCRVVAP